MKPLNPDTKHPVSESRVTLETIISVGVVGWLAMGIVLMGLRIWQIAAGAAISSTRDCIISIIIFCPTTILIPW